MRQWTNLNGLWAISTLMVGLMCAGAGGVTIYVDAGAAGANNGSSWSNAYARLQDALVAAASGDEIRVAQGIYTPDQGGGKAAGDRTATFQLKSGVAVKGGYAGNMEDDPDARNIEAYESVLSGDLNGDDGANFENNGENSYHVVISSGTSRTAVLDGFTISGGNSSDGAGMYNDCGSPTVRNCTFRGNRASNNGGGMYNYEIDSSPVVKNCIFFRNTGGNGGGICNFYAGNPILSKCTFIQNTALIDGGGVYIIRPNSVNYEGTYPKLTHCTFAGNRAVRYGGAMYNWGNEFTFPLSNCLFSGNFARFGGGIYNKACTPATTNCTFGNNQAQEKGGGMYNSSDAPVLTNCILWGNRDSSGATQSAQFSENAPIVSYCCVEGWTGNLGGAGNMGADPLFLNIAGIDNIIGTEDDNLRLLSGSPCVDAGNNAAVAADIGDLDGDGNTTERVPFDLDGDARVVNDPAASDSGSPPGAAAIVDMGSYENPKGVFVVNPSRVTVSEGDTASFAVTLAYDPLAVIEVTVRRHDGDADLVVESGEVLTFDSSNYQEAQTVTLAAGEDGDHFNGVAHIWISGPGMAPSGVTAIEADKEPYQNILLVDADATGVNDGTSWSDAFNDLQEALRLAKQIPYVEELEIWVAEGTYRPAGLSGSRSATFQLLNRVAVMGGFAGFGQSNPDDRDVEFYTTILSGDLNSNDGADFANNGENSYHVITGSGVDATAMLDGFTITGGNANGSKPDNYGGGMYIYDGTVGGGGSSNPNVVRCTFWRNSASGGGGGMYSESGNTWYTNHPTLTSCVFIENRTNVDSYKSGGGGMCNRRSNPTLTECMFIRNRVRGYSPESYGGGMRNYESSPSLAECSFIENTSEDSGAGMANFASNATLTDCVFRDNEAQSPWRGGGAVYNYSNSNGTLTRCTFSGNYAMDSGGAVHNQSSSPSLTDCFLEGNSAVSEGGGIYNNNGSPRLTRCLVRRNQAESGGGLRNITDNSILTNCIFSENTASLNGGGIYNSHNSRVSMIHCTISGNSAGQSGGGICNYDNVYYSDAPVLTNCILWGNLDSRGTGEAAQIEPGNGTPVVNYCCAQGWSGALGGVGNIDAAPFFVDASSGDYHLQAGSPCIDGGCDAGVYRDFEGNLRPWDNPHVDNNGILPEFDMGAYEFVNTPPVADAGDDGIVYAGPNGMAEVTLDGSGSYDPDGDELTYHWSSTSQTITSTISDEIIDLKDFAKLAQNWQQTNKLTENTASASMKISGLADFCKIWLTPSSQSNHDSTYDNVTDSPYFTIELPLGVYVFTLIVNDGIADSEPNNVVITVLDNTPPEFTLTVEPTLLWPPNHKMVQVTPTWAVSDNCDSDPHVSLVSITMNEGDETATYDPGDDIVSGDGNTIDDIQQKPDGFIYLRAERSGKGLGRIYTITYQAVDASGNVTEDNAIVTVPHDQSE